MKTYTAKVTREGKWWMVAVPEIDGLTQARRLGEVEQMARELIAVTIDAKADDIDVKVIYTDVHGIDVAGALASIEADRLKADTLSAQARERTELLAKHLSTAGVPVRDIGTILNVSFQRAHQLVTGSK